MSLADDVTPRPRTTGSRARRGSTHLPIVGAVLVVVVGVALLVTSWSDAVPPSHSEPGDQATVAIEHVDAGGAAERTAAAVPSAPRDTADVEVSVVDTLGAPLAGAKAYSAGDAAARWLDGSTAFATSDARGRLTVPRALLVQEPEHHLVVAREGYRTRSAGRLRGIAPSDVIVLERALPVTVEVTADGRPLEGVRVLVSREEFDERDLAPVAIAGASDRAALYTATTGPDGIARLWVPSDGPHWFVASKLGYVTATEGHPFRRDTDRATVSVAMARVYAALATIERDRTLTYGVPMPPFLDIPGGVAVHVGRLRAELRQRHPSALCVLGVVRDGHAWLGTETIPAELFLAQRGHVSAALPVRPLEPDMLPTALAFDDLPPRAGFASFALAWAAGDSPPTIAPPAVPLTLVPLRPDGTPTVGDHFAIRIVCGERMELPAGRYRLHSLDPLVARCLDVEEHCEVLEGIETSHRVRLLARVWPVRFVTTPRDPVVRARIRGSGDRPEDRLVRSVDDLREATLWLTPGSWKLGIAPILGAGERVVDLTVPEQPEGGVVIVHAR